MRLRPVIRPAKAALPLDERLMVVDSLLRSLNPPDPAIDNQSAAIPKRPLPELPSGRLKPVSGQQVLAKLQERFPTTSRSRFILRPKPNSSRPSSLTTNASPASAKLFPARSPQPSCTFSTVPLPGRFLRTRYGAASPTASHSVSCTLPTRMTSLSLRSCIFTVNLIIGNPGVPDSQSATSALKPRNARDWPGSAFTSSSRTKEKGPVHRVRAFMGQVLNYQVEGSWGLVKPCNSKPDPISKTGVCP